MTPLTFNHVVRQRSKPLSRLTPRNQTGRHRSIQPGDALLIRRRWNLPKLRDDNVSGVRQGCHWHKTAADVRLHCWSPFPRMESTL